MDRAKATVIWENKSIIFEGPSEFVAEQVAKFAMLSSKQETHNVEDRDAFPVSAEQFAFEKGPKGHHETVAVLAFFLTENGVTEFGEGEMRRSYLQARIRPPKVMAQALRDAKNRFDYLEAGSVRGSYRLSPHGDRTVRFDLPRRER